MGSLKEYMEEEVKVSRFKIVTIGMAGLFCGCALTVVFMWGASLAAMGLP